MMPGITGVAVAVALLVQGAIGLALSAASTAHRTTLLYTQGRSDSGSIDAESVDVSESLAEKVQRIAITVKLLHSNSSAAAEADAVARRVSTSALLGGVLRDMSSNITRVVNTALADQTVGEAKHNKEVITADDMAILSGQRGEDTGWAGHETVQGDCVPSGAEQLSLLQSIARGEGPYIGAGKPWTNGVVKYCFASDANDDARTIVPLALEQIRRALPCLVFENVGHSVGTNSANDDTMKECSVSPAIFVQTRADSGCWSHVGELHPPINVGSALLKTQLLNLGPGCYGLGTVMHEFLHAMGMAHEQSRPDRDDHVVIHWENIKQGKENNFVVDDNGYIGAPYEYDSIMHYCANAFSVSGEPTISAEGFHGDLGQRVGLSQGDANQLAKMYEVEGGDEVMFSKIDVGSTSCADLARDFITTESECMQAATILGLRTDPAFDGVDSPRGRPYGCFSNAGKRIFKGIMLNLNDDALANNKGTSNDGTTLQLCKQYVPVCRANMIDQSGDMMCTDLNATDCVDLADVCARKSQVANCCACGGGVESRCYSGVECPPLPQALPIPPSFCIVTTTTIPGYECLVRNECSRDVKVECPAWGTGHWRFNPSSSSWKVPPAPSNTEMCDSSCVISDF